MSHLQLSGIEKRFGNTIAVDGVSLALEQGEIVCLLGPSGCGKTTLLRLVAGLESADSGNIQLDNRNLPTIPTYQRGIGMMFQSYALFPHMSVAENIAYGLKMQKAATALIDERVRDMLALVAMTGLDNRRIDQLSGGQQQRVALARSLATQPSILLLDEPLGSLDRLLRERLLDELRGILKRVGVTALYVTHDQSEAFGIADRVAVMNQGRIEQIAAPQQLYTRPANQFVATFLGLNNLVSVRADDALGQSLGAWLQNQAGRDDAMQLLIPPYAAMIAEVGEFRPNLIPLTATVNSFSFRGRFALLTCTVGKHTLTFSIDPYASKTLLTSLPQTGSSITLHLDPRYLVYLDQSR
ncbi:MAG: ABC transporter ATP-binding protein [Candidatus Promineifilaceae bacterium]